MRLDEFGLITTKNSNHKFDGGDTLSNEGFYRVGLLLLDVHDLTLLDYTEIRTLLRRDTDGLWVRHPSRGQGSWQWNDPEETGRDQLDPWVMFLGEEAYKGNEAARIDLHELWINMWKRLWFYQNKDWGGAYLSIWIRAKRMWPLYWLLPLTDLAILGDSIAKAYFGVWDHDKPGLWKFRPRGPTDVDDKVHVCRMAQGWFVQRTWVLEKAVKLYIDKRPPTAWSKQFFNYKLGKELHAVAAMYAYFRKESGNNEEIFELWIIILKMWHKHFYPIIK